jgi:DNA (cytosine-5)-methyltransferase 1
MPDRLRAIDLCSGAGGWACAARGLPIDIVAAVDWGADPCQTYRLNHPETRVICGDLMDDAVIDELRDVAGDVDVVLGGIPCEWVSRLRALTPVQHAERESQRALLDRVLEVTKSFRPKYWCLEDVIGLRKELPPLTPYQILDSRHWSCQRRKRIYVGLFPRPKRGTSGVLRDKSRPGPYRIGPRLFGREPVCSMGRKATHGAFLDRIAPTIFAVGSRYDGELAVLDPRVRGGMRQMEWQEAAVLQGFPEDYLFYGAPTSVSRQISRAVQIDTGRAILRGMS